VTTRNPHIIWASVAIIMVLVVGVVILVVNGKDVGAIKDLAVLIAIPVLSAFGVAIYQKVDHTAEKADIKLEQVKEATNGSNDKLLRKIEDLHAQIISLALQVPVVPPSGVPPSTEPDQDDHTQAVLLQPPR
jgi:hypothetical protein